MLKLLVIQTAFTGDVVLATAVVENLHVKFPNTQIDFLLRKGNETLFDKHPYITKVWIWDKKVNKIPGLLKLAFNIRKEKYSHVINLHRYGSSGFITFLSGAGYKAGFDKNPFSFCFNKKVKHIISEPYSKDIVHEVMRNYLLLTGITNMVPELPKLYPSAYDYHVIKQYQAGAYICIAPSSVWFTKQFPAQKWVELIDEIPSGYKIYIIGGPSDNIVADRIISNVKPREIQGLCGALSYLQSAALMQGAVMNYVNDSAPLHFATAMDAPVTAVFCSTVPAFGFGPLNENGKVVEIEERLYCRPCGLHGHKACPEGHFKCALQITNKQLLWWIPGLKKI